MSRFMSPRYAGLTPYVPGEQPQDRTYIKLNTNESPFPPSPLAQRLARQEAGSLQLYPDPDCAGLAALAAETFGLETDQFVFVNGSDDALYYSFTAFCDAETPAVFADITYGFYRVFAGFCNVPYTEIPLNDDFTIPVDRFLNTGKTVFIANPNAPTGLVLPLEDVERIAAGNPDNVVVVDEAYIDFGGESALALLPKYENLLVIRTFSKSRSMAGARLGFAAGNSGLIADLQAVRNSINPYNINRMTMAAGIGALSDKEYFEKCVAEICAIREWVTAELRRLGFTLADSSTNFVFAKHPAVGGQELYQNLKEKGILVRHFETPRLRDYNRISIGSREEMAALVAALEDLL